MIGVQDANGSLDFFNSAAVPLASFMSPDIKNANQTCHSLVEN